MAYKFYANCSVKGSVDSIEKKENKSKTTGENFEVLNFAIESGENKIRGKFLNSKARPNLVNELNRQYKRGDKVGVSGRLIERHYLNNQNQDAVDKTPIFFNISDMGDDEKDISTFMIQGYVARMKETDDGVYKIYFDVLNEDKDGVITVETFETEADEDLVAEFADHGFDEKSYAKVAGFMVNKFILDEFNQVIDSKRGLEIKKLYSCVAEDDVLEGEMKLYLEAKKAAKQGKKIKRKTAAEDADGGEEEAPKGRRRRSTFDEDDE